jgi:hypothetical protein
LDKDELQAFLTYKKEKTIAIAGIEDKRLGDLKDARSTVFKYALPASIVDGVGGVVGTLVTGNILIMLPVGLFLVLIFFLARFLDREKYAERNELMEYTESALYDIRLQEIELFRRASSDGS